MKSFLLTLCTLCFAAFLAGQELQLLRFPALSPDGTTLAFAYQGDIWKVPAGGGAALRLTVHEAYESEPRWSPDGRQILFLSNRFGNRDLFVMPAEGGPPKRLTHHSARDEAARWMGNETVVFATRRLFAQVEREDEIHQVGLDGGTPRRLLDDVGLMPAPSPDGLYLALVRGTCRITREGYRGPANRDIWLYDIQSGTYTRITTDAGQDIYPSWDREGNLYFLSARTGHYNLYRQPLEEGRPVGRPEALTDYTDTGIRYFDLDAAGERFVLERGGELLLWEKGESKPLQVNLATDYRFDPVEDMTFTEDLEGYDLSPDGKQLALSVRGELFAKAADKERQRSARLTRHPWKDSEPLWLNDSTLLFLSDRDGRTDLFLLRSADADQPDLTRTFKTDLIPLTRTEAEESGLAIAPDTNRIAFVRGRGQLVVAEVDPEKGVLINERVWLDGWATPNRLQWSPDGRYLAYDMTNLDFNREVFILPLEEGAKPVNVSMHPRSDFGAVWSADGSKLGFLSNRNNGDNDIWFAWLKKEDWEKTKRDWEEEAALESEKSKKDTAATALEMEVDLADIHERLQQVTRMPGNEHNLAISKDGETFYFSTNGGGWTGGGGKNGFFSIQWDGEKLEQILDDERMSALHWDKKHEKLFFRKRGGKLSLLDLKKKKAEAMPFEAEMEVDHQAERQQIFDDAWRALRDGFYDPQFHGQDWDSLRAKYEPWCLAASTSQDFRDLFNELLGQLDASHMGMYGPDPEETQKHQTGLLGIEGVPEENGFRIKRVLPESPAERTESRLREGELLTAVNGQPIAPSTNLYALLKGKADERTLLEVTDAAGESREVIIRPASSLRSELYEAWVDERKDLCEQYSDGRLGYIHIQGMNWPSFERFERELTASGQGKEGIVIDVRYNGGGWTTDMLMTVLNVRQHAYTIPRGAAENLRKEHAKFRNHYPFGERLPLSAWTKPSVALCNQNSYSNAEIFSHAYKTLGHGTLVGQPTFGAVISTGSHSLLDGSRVRMPFRAWYVKATDVNMEHGPAVPDILVDNPPGSKEKGEDLQLRRAVETLLQQLDEE